MILFISSDAEEWRPWPDQTDYIVSNHGRVMRSGKILKPMDNGKGYPYYTFWKNNRRKNMSAHRLVAIIFLGDPPEKHVACHNDGNPLNCHVSNIRWDTMAGNQADRIRHDTHHRGERQGSSRLTNDQAREVLNLRNSGHTLQHIADKFGVHRETIGHLVRGKSWGWMSHDLRS